MVAPYEMQAVKAHRQMPSCAMFASLLKAWPAAQQKMDYWQHAAIFHFIDALLNLNRQNYNHDFGPFGENEEQYRILPQPFGPR